MSVIYKTNGEIFQQQIVNCVNVICALRHQLHDSESLGTGIKFAIETSLIEASTRLDTLLKSEAGWALPKLDNQNLASQKFEQDNRMAEYGLWAQEVNKQVALGNIVYSPSPMEVPPQPSRKSRKKKK